MATSLVSQVMQFLTPDMIAKIASALGLERTVGQKAITGAVPAILSGLAGLASTPDGARRLSGAMSQQGTGVLDSLQNMIGGSGQKAFADSGASMLSGLLGGGATAALTQSVGKFAGIGEGASKSLLGMLGPVVMGALGRQQHSAGLDASGLASMLVSQKDQFVTAIPSGLADRLDASGLFDSVTGGVRTGAATVTTAASRLSDMGERTVASASHAAYAVGDRATQAARGTTSTQWPLWVIGAVALAALGWYLLSGTDGDKVADARPPASTPPVQTQAAPARTTTERVMDTAAVALSTPNLMVGGVNLANNVNASVTGLKSALAGISDSTSAQAALPKIRDAIAQLDEVKAQSTKLPAEGKSALAKLIASAMPTINQLCDQVLAVPGVGGIAKPTIDELRGKLDTLARA